MKTRRTLLLAAAATMGGTAASIAAMPARGLPPRIWDPVLGEIPVCRGGIGRGGVMQAQYREGTQREAATAQEADADFLEKMGLLDGHLLIGRALLEANETRLALPHFGHPVRELYTWLQSRLAARRAAGFEDELQTLERLAQANDKGPGFDAAWRATYAKMDAARATVAREHAASTRFMVEHAATMVEAVAGDFGESIERGRITNVLEYHDSAGFLRYAFVVAERERKTAPAAWDGVLAELIWIRDTAYPNLLPPARPPVSISAVRARAGRVRALAGQA